MENNAEKTISHGANRGSNPRGDANNQTNNLAQNRPPRRVLIIPGVGPTCPVLARENPRFTLASGEKVVRFAC